MITPKTFCMHPWNSVTQECESEIIARNIMVILSRTGDTFRELTWDEYVLEREKDDGCGDEESRFDDVVDYCKSAETAVLFSKTWKEAASAV